MKFEKMLLEIASRYDDDYSESEVCIEIRRGNTLMLVPIKIYIETDHEDICGNPIVSIGQINLTNDILDLFNPVEQLGQNDESK